MSYQATSRPRYATGHYMTSRSRPRYALGIQLISRSRPMYGMLQYYSRSRPRYGLGGNFTSRSRPRYAFIDAQYLNAIAGGTGGAVPPPGQPDNLADWDVSLVAVTNGVSHTIDRAFKFTITPKESDTLDWTLEIFDEDGQRNPEGTGSWAGVLTDQAWDANNNVVSTLYVSCVVGGMQYRFPPCIPNSYSYKRSSRARHFAFTWKGTGPAERLRRKKVNMPEINSTAAVLATVKADLAAIQALQQKIANESGSDKTSDQALLATLQQQYNAQQSFNASHTSNIIKVQDALLDTFARAGVKAEVSGVTPNYIVVKLPRQGGTPLEYIEQLLAVTGAKWMEMTDGTIKCYQPQLTTAPIYRTIDGTEQPIGPTSNFAEVDVDRAAVHIVNKVTVQRVRNTGSILDEESGNNVQFPGKQLGPFSLKSPVPPSVLGVRELLQLGGETSDFWFFSGKNTLPSVVLDPRGLTPQLAPAQTVDSYTFTWAARDGDVTTTGGSYDFQITAAIGLISPNDHTVTAIVQDSASIAKYGIWAEELPPNELIPDGPTLINYGNAYLATRSRRSRGVKFNQLPLDPGIQPAVRMGQHDPMLGSSIRYPYLRQVTHVLSDLAEERTSSPVGEEYVLT